ncbi:hypothetical protein HGRIS_008031 [Hohenbuehelia grisea]|uniref:Cytochrome P450 n=1 Tax=Hohenbuehelia grisea TaxID=104357 RepID=A0ABR3J7G9_9AGAR
MLIYIIAAILVWLALVGLPDRRRRQPLPPGPPGLPLVGNLGERPGKFPWLRYTNLGQKYGEVVYFQILGQPIVVLNSKKAITELMEKRSLNYADRPALRMNTDLAGWHWNFAHMRYNEVWRKHRKTFHRDFNANAVERYYPTQMKATHDLLRNLLNSPQKFTDHVKTHAVTVILRVVYGYDTQEETDYYVALAGDAMEGLSQTTNAGSYLVDFIPILKYVPAWMPGASFKRLARKWRAASWALRDKPFARLKAAMANGSAPPSFARDQLEKADGSDSEMENVIRNCAGIAYFGPVLRSLPSRTCLTRR